jgi:hypothetical protein
VLVVTVLLMRRVAVVGCGGSGKTTLANQLAARLALSVVHIDSHYWRTIDGIPSSPVLSSGASVIET